MIPFINVSVLKSFFENYLNRTRKNPKMIFVSQKSKILKKFKAIVKFKLQKGSYATVIIDFIFQGL